MIEITKQYRTETGHRLMNYNGKCSHLHGHSYLWEVTVTAPEADEALQEKRNGMVTDFANVKDVIKAVIEPFDHAMVLAHDDPLLPILWVVGATNGKTHRVIKFPVNPTAENFALYLGNSLDKHLMQYDVRLARMRVWETATSFAEWTPRSTGEKPYLQPWEIHNHGY